jgi:hypothetical protein
MTGYGYGGDPGLAVPDPGSIGCAETLKSIGGILFASSAYSHATQAYTEALVFTGSVKSAHLLIAAIEEKLGHIFFKRQQYASSLDHYDYVGELR